MDKLNVFEGDRFCCSGGEPCLPAYLRCNGISDCPDMSDEANCDTYVCPGLYRCRSSKICIPLEFLCTSNMALCPEEEDSYLCGKEWCPHNCTCPIWKTATCTQTPDLGNIRSLRYLDASNTGTSVTLVASNSMLIHLILRNCELTQLAELTVLPNVRILDFSKNFISSLSNNDLTFYPNLYKLDLSHNPLRTLFDDNIESYDDFALRVLDFSKIHITEFDFRLLNRMPNLKVLNLTDCQTENLIRTNTLTVSKLQVLDIRGCEAVKFSKTLFKGMDSLYDIYTDNFKLCCKAVLPESFDVDRCRSTRDTISSCLSLLYSDMYRIALGLFAILSLTGNSGSFFVRVFRTKQQKKCGFDVFVVHLCVADFLMGVYLTIIGLADSEYRGEYVWRDTMWRESWACKLAGFLSLASSEVSALVVCLITVDRLLVLRFPFSKMRFGFASGQLMCSLVWASGTSVAALPLLPGLSHWRFYSQTGICIPLPFATTYFPGQTYAFAVMVLVNFVLFLLIAVGQVLIYDTILSSALTTGQTTQKANDATVARRLLTIVVSNFLCWFPVGVLGILAWRGVQLPSELSAAVAVFVLPLNSALNPYLYTLNTLLERRRIAKERQLLNSIYKQQKE